MPARHALAASDHRIILRVLDDVAAAADADEFSAAMVHGVRTAVPSDVVALNEVDPATDRVVFMADPASWSPAPELSQVLAELAPHHPLIRLFNDTGDGSAHKISDFWSQEEFHHSPLYQRLYRPMGVEYQMSITLPAPRPIIVALSLNRDTTDFAERDRLVLNTLRPHLSQMWRSTRERVRLAALLRAATNALAADQTGVVVAEDPPHELTPGALVTIYRFFGRPGRDSPMPARVDQWLAHHRLPRAADELPPLARPLSAQLEGRSAILRYLPGHGGQPDVILVRETVTPLGVGRLEALGLSAREAQVLQLVAEGASNPGVARQLHISPGTVKKHLDHIYAKLGVSGRVRAAAVLLDIEAHHT